MCASCQSWYLRLLVKNFILFTLEWLEGAEIIRQNSKASLSHDESSRDAFWFECSEDSKRNFTKVLNFLQQKTTFFCKQKWAFSHFHDKIVVCKLISFLDDVSRGTPPTLDPPRKRLLELDDMVTVICLICFCLLLQNLNTFSLCHINSGFSVTNS
jgi:hypothetical protein